MLEHDGQAVIWYPLFNCAHTLSFPLKLDEENLLSEVVCADELGDYDRLRTTLEHPHTVVGVADGGAHVGVIQDAANCSYLLTHWARDRSRGNGVMPIEHLVRDQTQGTARLFGMEDRGTLEPGMKADINSETAMPLRFAISS